MPMEIPAETPVENGLIVRVVIDETRVNPTTGEFEEIDPTGLTVVCFISDTKELSSANPIGTLTTTLTNISGTRVWHGGFTGAALTSQLLPTWKDKKVQVHATAGTEWHERGETTIIDDRT